MARRPFLTPQQKRERSYLSRHPGADNPRSPNYDPHWKQRARGHRLREHVTRAERAIAAGRVTSAQQQSIRRFADKQAKRLEGEGLDRDDVYQALKDLADRHGYAAFEQSREMVNRLSRRRRVRVERWKRRDLRIVQFEGEMAARGANRAAMHALAERFGIDWRLLFYH